MDRFFTRRVCGARGARPPALLQWPRWVALAIGAIGALAGTAAAQVPDEGFLRISTFAEDNNQEFSNRIELTLPLGYSADLRSLFQMDRGSFFPGGSRFPTNPSNQPEGYYSAVMEHNRVGAVGASGTERGLPSGSAFATYVEPVTNHGAAATVPLNWHIPAIEVGVYAYDYSDAGFPDPIPEDSRPVAAAQARLSWERLDTNGVSIGTGVVFDYYVDLQKDRWGFDLASFSLAVTSDLGAETPEDQEPFPYFDVLYPDPNGFGYDRRAVGAHWDAFSGAGSVAIGAGETLVFTYLMGATIGEPNPVIDDIVIGLHALVGDPFNIGSDSGFTIGAVQPVPEPSSVLQLVVGGIVLAFLLRRERAPSASHTDERAQ